MAASNSFTDFYKVLQVDPSAEAEVIEAAYKRLARKYHPDANPSEDATERMQSINVAYDVLRDVTKRRDFDNKRAAQEAAARAAAAPPPPPTSSSTTPPAAAYSSPVADRARMEEAERIEAMRVVTEDRLRELQRARVQEAERQAEEERLRRGETPPAGNPSIWTAQDYTIMQNMPESMRPPSGASNSAPPKAAPTRNPMMENSAIWKLQDWQQGVKKRATGTFRAQNIRTIERKLQSRGRTQTIVAVVVIAVILLAVAALVVFFLQANPG